ncbi:hypothetical protein LTR36_007206 [Oleoguttula mirabilis]|uniref:Uncharacterized protein n=1 Tax=Oleoguttula mirabilis TaxID=1507867 RepID=A0AAV9JB22_9PEZI|nr:hypothetical protein LTR36_007206 [Oleoguttula mirabilis]
MIERTPEDIEAAHNCTSSKITSTFEKSTSTSHNVIKKPAMASLACQSESPHQHLGEQPRRATHRLRGMIFCQHKHPPLHVHGFKDVNKRAKSMKWIV